MRTLLLMINLLAVNALPASAQTGPVVVKFRLEIIESGSFLTKTIKELGTKEAAQVIADACKAFGTDCAQQADQVVELFKGLNAEQKEGPPSEEHHGLIRAPVGYEICKAKIDMANASIDDQSSFSGEIVRDRSGNGLGFYAEVPRNRPEGHSVEADLYLLYVPGGQIAQYGCFPTSDHSDIAHLWIVDHRRMVLMKPEAHYP